MILQALVRLYDRRASEGDMPPYGFSEEGISFAILLDREGCPKGTQSLQDTSGKRARPSRRLVPAQPGQRSVNVRPNFLWDNTGYALGVRRDRESGDMVRVRRGEHEAFKQLHADLLADQDDEGLCAVRRFLERWEPNEYEELPDSDEMLGANVTFMLVGTEGLVADRKAALSVWARHLSRNQGKPGPCLITGSHVNPVARLHPPIRGVAGAPSTGASLVSFNEPAFESHGRAQGGNAPVSELAAFKYGTALNALLARGSRRRISIGNTTVVFWAEAGSRQEAEAAEDACFLLTEPPPGDDDEAVQVRKVLKKAADGYLRIHEVRPECEEDTRFYVLGLEPNRARLAVRFWYETTIGDLARRVGEHWSDMRLEPEPWRTPPGAWRLLLETAVQRKRENISPSLVAPLTRAIFIGSQYPQSLLSSVLARLRADGNLTGVRAAMLKACIRRPERMSQPGKEDDLVSLDTTSGNVPYLLGRLFAVFVYAEDSLMRTTPEKRRSATISDRWFGSASSAPRRAFPSLMRGFRHNISKLDKDSKRRNSGRRADRVAGEIADALPSPGDLPSFMVPEDQARFFVGYYHQERALYTRTSAGETDKEESE